mmetsp:Transcript_15142/g.10633  ORF Transcript_15142/g.10633 Transcript_15142/m.10633 type:complete len:103 (+) Transcript_15142:3344-3652(+)
MIDADKKVYQLTKELKYMPLLFTILTLSTVQQLTYQPALYSLIKKSKEGAPLDGPHFIMGLLTIFKQFNKCLYKKYLMYLSHYFKNVVFSNSLQQNPTKNLP